MKRIRFATACLAVSLTFGAVTLLSLQPVQAQDATATPAPTTPPHWTYEGEDGPDKWGELDPAYALCATGEAQSPIDLTGAQAVDLKNIQFDWQPSAMNVFNNGHTIQVNYDAGSFITYNEIQYQLVQFHFHHPSEHTINGEFFPMELHFVHKDANGALAVVGVMLKEGKEDNPAFADLFANLPAEKGDPQPTTITLDANLMIPADHTFTTYVGSLTTPPCTQGVRWLVLSEPVELSAKQLEAFSAIFELNARPVQALNDRDLLEDSSEN